MLKPGNLLHKYSCTKESNVYKWYMEQQNIRMTIQLCQLSYQKQINNNKYIRILHREISRTSWVRDTIKNRFLIILCERSSFNSNLSSIFSSLFSRTYSSCSLRFFSLFCDTSAFLLIKEFPNEPKNFWYNYPFQPLDL